MEGIFAACKQSAGSIAIACGKTHAYKEEAVRLGRYVAKLALVLTEFEMYMHIEPEKLRGSEALFVAGEHAVAALKMVEQLVRQCAGTNTAAVVWAYEDAVEFQSASTELANAAAEFASLARRLELPKDLVNDAEYVEKELTNLKFTLDELERTEEQEEEEEQEKWADRRLGHDHSNYFSVSPRKQPTDAQNLGQEQTLENKNDGTLPKDPFAMNDSTS